ncbi:MAG: GTPase HflX, partial [Agathobaculum sp.]|uniref:GTPase HflX n=1 Tax=Agathobaculum sp. TaxID=2048138 RepID=UPI003D8A9E07
MTENQLEQQVERAVLVGLSCPGFTAAQGADERTMDELRALAETAGAQAVAMTLQRRPAPDARTFIGEGKAEEVKALAEANDATLILFDNELSPSQMRSLEEMTGRTVLDRSALILDIFAQRARTGEGKLQVELAQYQYILPRLSGMWTHLVRQTAGGGKSPIGTRGPGETQLETDRRHIRRRIDKLKSDLEQVRQVRAVQRRQRKKTELPMVAIVGYTNAGKSTLLNTLTGANIEANDRLFDTLDPTTRKKRISDTQEILLSDTVGFIRKLPHHLVSA